MSGGHFSDYKESDICRTIFGYDITPEYGFGEEKYYKKTKDETGEYVHYSSCYHEDYLETLKWVLRRNPMLDKKISELVYDVLCLVHSLDYALSGDIRLDQYKDDKRAFKQKWLKLTNQDYAKSLIDSQVEDLKKELYEVFDVKND